MQALWRDTPAREFTRAGNGYANTCKPCRKPTLIPEPEDIDVMTFRGFDFRLPEEIKPRIRVGGNYRVTLALHVERAEARPSNDPRFVTRWLEVLAVEG